MILGAPGHIFKISFDFVTSANAGKKMIQAKRGQWHVDRLLCEVECVCVISLFLFICLCEGDKTFMHVKFKVRITS